MNIETFTAAPPSLSGAPQLQRPRKELLHLSGAPRQAPPPVSGSDLFQNRVKNRKAHARERSWAAHVDARNIYKNPSVDVRGHAKEMDYGSMSKHQNPMSKEPLQSLHPFTPSDSRPRSASTTRTDSGPRTT